MLLAIPATLVQIFCFYFANLKENIYFMSYYNKEAYGFLTDYRFNELEYSIMILYFTLQVFYIKQVTRKKKVFKNFQSQISVSKDNYMIQNKHLDIFSINVKQENGQGSRIQNPTEIFFPKEKEQKSVNLFDVLIAFIAKYSDIISLFSLFWISMYTVNILHLILVFFFLLFSIQMGTSLSSNSKKEDISSKTVNFVRKFWVFLIIYVNFIIFLRYLWVLLIIPYCGNEFLSYPAVLFVGITYDYHISPSIGLVKEGLY